MSDLHTIIEQAGSMRSPPPTPKQLPKRWVPAPIRFALKSFVLPFVFIDRGAKKIARWIIRPPFIKKGACKRRGNCCYFITLRKQKGLFFRLHLFWITQIHGFFFRSKKTYEAQGRSYYLMGCRYLQEDGSCGQYRLRPTICREWPVIETFAYPKMLKGCGYSFAARKPRYQHVVDEYDSVMHPEREEHPLKILR